MKRIEVSVNTWYVVEGAAGSTVINPSTGRAVATVEEGKQTAFYALTPYVLVSDDSVTVNKANFKGAPVWMFGSGGGTVASSPLPDGYIEADFLEWQGNDYISLPLVTKAGDSVYWSMTVQYTKITTGKQAEGKNGTPYFFVGLNGTEWYYGLNSSIAYTGKAADFSWHNVALSYTPEFSGLKIDSDSYKSSFSSSAAVLSTAIALGLSQGGTSYCNNRKRKVSLLVNNKVKYNLKPCLNASGVASFYDSVSKKSYKGAGSKVIAGFTLAQARKLGNLPDGGGNLTVALPSNWRDDAGVLDALAEAEAKGWDVGVVSYDNTGETSAFSMRRIWVKKAQDEYGCYVAADGSRWVLEWIECMIGAEPEEYGYEPFRSVEAAIEYWALEPYVNPEEELLTEPTTNEYE